MLFYQSKNIAPVICSECQSRVRRRLFVITAMDVL